MSILEQLRKIRIKEAESFRERTGSLEGFNAFWTANETELIELHDRAESGGADKQPMPRKLSEIRTVEDKSGFIRNFGFAAWEKIVERNE